MKNWNNFINEEYRDEIPPKYMEKIIEFINDILKENGLSWNEYLEIEEYVDSLSRDELGDGGLNLYINTVAYNSLLTVTDFKAKDLAHAKKFIKKEMTRNIALGKQKDEADEERKEFDIILNELTDLYKLYPNDKESFQSYSHDEMITIIPESVKELHLLFKKNSKKLYVVGGAVRDFLNSEKPKDFDLCTDATPDEVLDILGRKYKTNLQGKAFGVVVVYTQDQPKGMEIATFREDQYNDKLGVTRNPDVKFSTIEKDVERRDIPYNALFFDLDKKEIVDLVGGVEDLKNKTTRFVGNPSLRIEEDPLRILRLLRFNCRYKFTINDETAKAIEENRNKLKIISRERIWALSGDYPGEVFKAWKQSKSFTEYLNLFNRFDLWEDVMPGVNINRDIKDSKFLEVYLSNILINNNPDKLLNKLVQEFKIEVDMARKIVFLISLVNLDTNNVIDLYKKRQVASVSDDVILDWYKINSISDKIHKAFLNYKPSVDSKELMDKGFQGAQLGAEIKRLEIEKFKQML